jgi:hypothetical protein
VRLEAQHEFFDVDRHVVFAHLVKRVLQVLLNKEYVAGVSWSLAHLQQVKP